MLPQKIEPVQDIGRVELGNMKKKISRETSDKILDKMGYKFNPVEFYLGMNSELEQKDVTHGNMVMTAKIAAAHLKENPKYYSLLKKYVETVKKVKKVSEDGFAIGTGLNLPDGSINGAPKPKDVKNVHTHLNKENVMVKLSELILENKYNRVDLVKMGIELKKIADSVSETDKLKLMERFREVEDFTSLMNSTPYTIFNATKWNMLIMILYGKLAELYTEVEKIEQTNKNLDCTILLKAIQDIITL